MSEARTSEAPSAPPPSPTTETTPSLLDAPPPAPVLEAPAAAPAAPAPDPYDGAKLALPEGFDKGERFEKFETLIKDSGWSQKQAQGLIDLYVDAVQGEAQRQQDVWQQAQAKWQSEVKADPELGGPHFDSTRQTISKVLDMEEFGGPEARKALIEGGYGNRLPVIRFLARVGKALTEGGSVMGEAAERARDGSLNGERPSIANAIYGPSGPHSGGPRLS